EVHVRPSQRHDLRSTGAGTGGEHEIAREVRSRLESPRDQRRNLSRSGQADLGRQNARRRSADRRVDADPSPLDALSERTTKDPIRTRHCGGRRWPAASATLRLEVAVEAVEVMRSELRQGKGAE